MGGRGRAGIWGSFRGCAVWVSEVVKIIPGAELVVCSI